MSNWWHRLRNYGFLVILCTKGVLVYFFGVKGVLAKQAPPKAKFPCPLGCKNC